MGTQIDFKQLSDSLLSQAQYLLPQWLPGGRLIGSEYTCGDLSGGEGDSLKVNINTGKWADFANPSAKGGDFISLYAAIYNLSQIEAANQLSNKTEVPPSSSLNPVRSSQQAKKPVELVMPTTPLSRFKHATLGIPSKTWAYYNETGQLCFYISRYETDKGKEHRPWSFNADGKWCNKAWPDNRPLLGVHELSEKPVLIVEGEKAYDAAKTICGHVYNIITWSGGAQAISKTNWNPLYGRKILIWPDADQAGIGAANRIADLLLDHCPEIKIINVSDLTQDGWDAADSGFTYKTWVDWAKPRVKLYVRPVDPDIVDNLPAMNEEPPKNEWGDIDDLVEYAEQSGALAAQVNEDKKDDLIKIGLSFMQNGKLPLCNASNASLVFEKYPLFKDKFWYDEFHRRVFTTFFTDEPIPVDDVIEVKIMILLQRLFMMPKISKTDVKNGILNCASYNIKNEPRDWMDTLVWDNVPRVHSFFHKYMGSVDSDYVQAVSKNFFIAMIARIYKPGCQVDNMVILEGDQGIGKSSALNLLGGKWYVDTKMDTDGISLLQIIQGQMLVEIGELAMFNKSESSALKRIITTRSDKFRTPYDTHPVQHGRTSLFVGTTNQDQYLNDPTGARRFWPIVTTSIDLEAIKRDREQLFAEAVHLYKSGATWWIVPDSAKEEQDLRQEEDGWETAIIDHLSTTQRSEINTYELAISALRMEPYQVNTSTKRRIASILKKMGWENKPISRNNAKSRAWVKTDRVTLDAPRSEKMVSDIVNRRDLPNFAPGMGITPLNK